MQNKDFPGGSASRESACNVGDLGLLPQLGRSPGKGNGYPLQYSGLGKFHRLYSPWGRQESNMTEQLSMPPKSIHVAVNGKISLFFMVEIFCWCGKPLQYSCLENPMNSMKRQKDIPLKDGPQVSRCPVCSWRRVEK